MSIYSVKLLLESTVTPNTYSSKTFEETIILIEAASHNEIETKIHRHFVDNTYENADGGQTTWSLVKILDTFEIIDEFEGNINFKEVYSRFLPFDEPITADEVIKLYYLDK
ncbi:DUF4288 domain-containing protein [Lysinibacillus sp. FSL R7-0073]|uniref:DUF4288 domain-containing protein n=1 Tax=Lysinibacillus TaxID=400634 RepID=UPI0025C0BD2B|nr:MULTISPECIES: DUF4288 domain-containing protein [Lysinibacillus]MED4887282.1 DUF4288 domain-containing protein [Lysinibacillus fusiformis]